MKLDGLFASNNVNVIRVFFIYIKYSFLMKLDGLFASSNVNTIRVYIYIYILNIHFLFVLQVDIDYSTIIY